MIGIFEIIGVIGATILLIAFILLEFKRISRRMISFHLLNFIGSSLLFIYAYLIKSYVFIILNIIWALASIYEIKKIK